MSAWLADIITLGSHWQGASWCGIAPHGKATHSFVAWVAERSCTHRLRHYSGARRHEQGSCASLPQLVPREPAVARAVPALGRSSSRTVPTCRWRSMAAGLGGSKVRGWGAHLEGEGGSEQLRMWSVGGAGGAECRRRN